MNEELTAYVAGRLMTTWFPDIGNDSLMPDYETWWEIALSDAEVAIEAVFDFLGDDGK